MIKGTSSSQLAWKVNVICKVNPTQAWPRKGAINKTFPLCLVLLLDSASAWSTILPMVKFKASLRLAGFDTKWDFILHNNYNTQTPNSLQSRHKQLTFRSALSKSLWVAWRCRFAADSSRVELPWLRYCCLTVAPKIWCAVDEHICLRTHLTKARNNTVACRHGEMGKPS